MTTKPPDGYETWMDYVCFGNHREPMLTDAPDYARAELADLRKRLADAEAQRDRLARDDCLPCGHPWAFAYVEDGARHSAPDSCKFCDAEARARRFAESLGCENCGCTGQAKGHDEPWMECPQCTPARDEAKALLAPPVAEEDKP